MAEKSEKEHLKRLQQGDLNSFKWIYEHYHEKVYGYCLKLTEAYPIAEEITEDVFVRLWEKRHIIDPSLSPGGLLLKITKDFVWNYFKKSSREHRQQSEYTLSKASPNPDNIESDLIFKDYLKIAETAIKQLPEKRQIVFNLRYKSGLDNQEIAEYLDISETTVRVHLFKATRFLRNYLRSHPEIPYLILLYFEV